MNTSATRRLGRLQRRLVRHHLLLAILSTVATLLVARTLRRSPDPVFRASLATGYVALGLLGGTLLTGPINVLRRRPNPVSSDLRRDFGIWTGVLSLAHVVLGLQVHLRGRPWLYFVYGPGEPRAIPIPVRVDLFGFANYTGLVATLLVLLLLVLSNDWSFRRLGTARWKRLQRWNYWLSVFVVLHSIAYQVVEQRRERYVVAFALVVLVVTVVQLVGYGVRARRQPARTA